MESGKLFLGVLVGVAVGATLGILFAPEKGTSTRKKISKKGDKYADELTEKFNQFVDSISNKFGTMTEEAMRMAESGSHKADEALEKATNGAK